MISYLFGETLGHHIINLPFAVVNILFFSVSQARRPERKSYPMMKTTPIERKKLCCRCCYGRRRQRRRQQQHRRQRYSTLHGLRSHLLRCEINTQSNWCLLDNSLLQAYLPFEDGNASSGEFTRSGTFLGHNWPECHLGSNVVLGGDFDVDFRETLLDTFCHKNDIVHVVKHANC